jgi:hypothetical protein
MAAASASRLKASSIFWTRPDEAAGQDRVGAGLDAFLSPWDV